MRHSVENILLGDRNDLSSIKIGDFGLSVPHKFTNESSDQQCGTIIYMAPEVARITPPEAGFQKVGLL